MICVSIHTIKKEKKMKRFSLTLLAIALSISSVLMTSCGSKDSSKDDDDKKEKSEAASKVESVADVSVEASADESASDASVEASADESATDTSVEASAEESVADVSEEASADESVADVSEEASAPAKDGTKTYSNSQISFSYPENMIESNGMLVDASTNSGIIVQTFAKTNEFQTMNDEQLKQIFGSQYEAAGGSVTSLETATITNSNNVEMLVIAIEANVSNANVYQAVLVFDSATKTNVVIISLTSPDTTILEIVGDSIAIVE
jgi:hypothetical protein